MLSGTESRATLVDLLDRVLDRGLVIDADIIISLAGVPLVGVSLRAAIAGIETMNRFGLMTEWDTKIRETESVYRKLEGLPTRGVPGTSSQGGAHASGLFTASHPLAEDVTWDRR
jgi:hypothetical protein